MAEIARPQIPFYFEVAENTTLKSANTGEDKIQCEQVQNMINPQSTCFSFPSQN